MLTWFNSLEFLTWTWHLKLWSLLLTCRLNSKEVVKATRNGFQATNPGVRTASIGLFVRLYMYMGEGLRAMVSDEKPALLTMIDAEIAKVKDQRPPAPIRGLRHQQNGGATTPEDSTVAAPAEEEPVEDMLPRTDVR